MSGEDIKTGVAAVAVVVSVGSAVITRRQVRKAERFGRRPVLVVRTNKQRTEWEIENIGKGPALDVVLLQCVEGKWRPLQMPELAADGSAPIPSSWLEENHSRLMARYRSIGDDERYVTSSDGDRSTMATGWEKVPAIEEPLPSHRDYR